MSLRAAYSHFRRSSNVAFAPLGMTSDQFVLLWNLQREGQATQQELVRLCFSDTATIGSMVTLLKRRGLVTRVAHPLDGRAWAVQLTEAGRDLTGKLLHQSKDLRAKLTSLFDEAELQILTKMLARVAQTMQPPPRKPATNGKLATATPNGRTSAHRKQSPRHTNRKS